MACDLSFQFEQVEHANANANVDVKSSGENVNTGLVFSSPSLLRVSSALEEREVQQKAMLSLIDSTMDSCCQTLAQQMFSDVTTQFDNRLRQFFRGLPDFDNPFEIKVDLRWLREFHNDKSSKHDPKQIPRVWSYLEDTKFLQEMFKQFPSVNKQELVGYSFVRTQLDRYASKVYEQLWMLLEKWVYQPGHEKYDYFDTSYIPPQFSNYCFSAKLELCVDMEDHNKADNEDNEDDKNDQDENENEDDNKDDQDDQNESESQKSSPRHSCPKNVRQELEDVANNSLTNDNNNGHESCLTRIMKAFS